MPQTINNKMNNKEITDMKSNYNWQIHAIKNGCECANDGEYIFDMIPGAANFHTHGLEQYNHPDFQLVLDYDLGTAADILNALGECVSNGEKFKAGDYVKGIFEDCDVRLDVFEESGRDVLRVIVPDANNIFPDEEGCQSSFCHQMLPTEELYINHYINVNDRTAVLFKLTGDFAVEAIENGDRIECYLKHSKGSIKSYMPDIEESDFNDVEMLLKKIVNHIEYYKSSFLNQDAEQDAEEYYFINRFEQAFSTYELDDGFIIDAYNFMDGMEFYLYHKDCSTKTLMYVWEKDAEVNYNIFANIDAYKTVYGDTFLEEPEII